MDTFINAFNTCLWFVAYQVKSTNEFRAKLADISTASNHYLIISTRKTHR